MLEGIAVDYVGMYQGKHLTFMIRELSLAALQ